MTSKETLASQQAIVRPKKWEKRSSGPSRGSRALLRAVTSIVVFLAVWEVIGRFFLTNRLMFSPVSDVALAFARLWSTGQLVRHVSTSASEFAIGFFIAAVVGTLFGMILAVRDSLREYAEPLVSALYATPTIALAPLFILWLGIGMSSKVAVVFLVAFFPIVLNTISGIRTAEVSLIEAARSFGANDLQIFTKVLLPWAVPSVTTGLRLGIGRGIVGIVVGELFGARAGLGYLIFVSSQSFDTPTLFVGVLILAATGVAASAGMQLLERKIAPWRQFKI